MRDSIVCTRSIPCRQNGDVCRWWEREREREIMRRKRGRNMHSRDAHIDSVEPVFGERARERERDRESTTERERDRERERESILERFIWKSCMG